ncbi:MAG: hypothetical protein HKN57_02925 [Xanthomonadales bacterium]|nr:hypothetical protein [Gammaproteobacteria bacterium]NND56179.1 hypothetical protein [Xanthomonadales bacterium]NNK50584.1 hypothetical protein [Xanthomonadales bacterium]
MKRQIQIAMYTLSLLLASSSLAAQDYAYHPELSDSFTVNLGWMRSKNSFRAEADLGDDLDDLIDFGDVLGVDGHSTFFNGQLKWKFGTERKWSLAGQYFSNSATGRVELDRDVEWDGNTFRKGTFVESGVKIRVARLFLGRSFFKNDRNDFGLGVGLHDLKLDLYIEGEIKLNDDTTGVRRYPVGASQVLPNIGAWYNFSPAKKWLIHGRVDWISASIGDYNGHMWNANAGINYQAFRHVGFDLSWQYFNLNANVDSDDWNGGVDLQYSGPVIAITGNW